MKNIAHDHSKEKQVPSTEIFNDIVEKREKSAYYDELINSPNMGGKVLRDLTIKTSRPLNNFTMYLLKSDDLSEFLAAAYNDTPMAHDIRKCTENEANALNKLFPNLRDEIHEMMDLSKESIITADTQYLLNTLMTAFLKALVLKDESGAYKYSYRNLIG